MKDKKYLERIILYGHKIVKYMQNVTLEEFIVDDEKMDAVLLNLQQIGETARKLSDDFKTKYQTIEWHKIIGLRNMISHEYEGIDLTIIYNTATTYINQLLKDLSNVD